MFDSLYHCPLVCAADKHAIPKVDNTNVDRSVATIHATLLGCLRRTARVRTLLQSCESFGIAAGLFSWRAGIGW